MKKKTIYILYFFSMVLLLPLAIDLFVNDQAYTKGIVALFLMAFGTWGVIRLQKKRKGRK